MPGKMKRNSSVLIGLALAVLALNGCMDTQSSAFGEEKAAPDEFAVYSRAPLSLPPDFGLRPPKPGASRPQTVMPRNEARQALLSSGGRKPVQPSQAAAADMTPGVRALLRETGADRADPQIRFLVNSETAALSGGGDENIADTILFWRNDPGLRGAVIDPAVEERRLRRKQAEGDSIDEAPGPIIRRSGGGVSTGRDEGGSWWNPFD